MSCKEKDPRRQISVAGELARRRAEGDPSVFGVMLESHLVEGNQAPGPRGQLTYGQSITDLHPFPKRSYSDLASSGANFHAGRTAAAGPRAAG